MSAPITYTDTPINDDYVFTGKKYAISNGRPGSTGFINYRNNPNSKKVINEDTGVIYNTIKEASIDLNINYSYLKQMISGIRKNKTKLRYV
jgi:hypothetical protein